MELSREQMGVRVDQVPFHGPCVRLVLARLSHEMLRAKSFLFGYSELGILSCETQPHSLGATHA